jgi:hypothetical protein
MGSASLYWPENGATAGVNQRPASKREATIVHDVNVALLLTKEIVRLQSGTVDPA